MMCRSAALVVVAVALALGWSMLGSNEGNAQNGKKIASQPYRSPQAVAVSPDGATIYATDRTAACVAVLNAADKSKRADIAVQGVPHGLCLSADGKTLYVAQRGAGSIAVIDTAKGTVTSTIPVGRWPIAVALAPKGNRLYVCNQDNNTVSVVDLGQGKVVQNIPVVREPAAAAVTADEKFVAVANFLPQGVSTDPSLAADISIIDAAKNTSVATIKLPPGSTAVAGICTSPDGKWAYAVHGLGHFNLPMTQLERGWVNTYALSIIDVAKGQRIATVLLDDLSQGAADPHTVVCAKDGSRLWISHSGTHEISTVEIGKVHDLLDGKVSKELAELRDGSLPNIWVRIQKDRKLISELAYDLTALYIAGAIKRTPAGGNGPRGIALSPDGQTLYAANHYSGTVTALNTTDGKTLATIAVGAQPKVDARRRGEVLFHDATKSFQYWHSCATCHPNDARMDGLRWDFVDDGLGNAMNTIALHNLAQTEPLHRLGTLKNVAELAKHGLTFTHGLVPTEQDIADLTTYLKSLKPEPSPYLTPEGKLSAAAQRGKILFESKKTECATCHSGPNFTDQKLYDVGTNAENEKGAKFKTTPLFELHRTAPFLHDGRALTLEEVLTKYNANDQHGKTKGLTKQEVDDLVAFMLAL